MNKRGERGGLWLFFLMVGVQVRPRSGAPRVEENEEIEVRNAANVELLWGGKRCDMRFSIFFFCPLEKWLVSSLFMPMLFLENAAILHNCISIRFVATRFKLSCRRGMVSISNQTKWNCL